MAYVMKALELEDTIKNYERRSSTGWFAPYYELWFFYFSLSAVQQRIQILTSIMAMLFLQEICFNSQACSKWEVRVDL